MPLPINENNDGSLHDAVLRMPSIEEMSLGGSPERLSEQARETGREANGKFKAKEPPPEAKDKPVPAKDSQAKEEPPEDDEDWLEEAGEEGSEPARYKLTDVLDGYKRVPQLENELSEAKKAQLLPADYEMALRETLQQRQQYAAALRQFAALNNSSEPNLSLITPGSQNYDPELYAQQRASFEAARQNMARVQQEFQRVTQEHEEQNELLNRATFTRERQKLMEFWPEIAKPEIAKQVREELEKRFGIDGAALTTVIDHRFYKLAKAALTNASAAEKQKEAVKVVRAKPKLVRGTARQETGSIKAARFSESMDRLQRSGSLEDAAQALNGLI